MHESANRRLTNWSKGSNALDIVMKELNNTTSNAHILANYLKYTDVTPVFDLDGVILSASHRIKIFTPQDHKNGICSRDQIGALDLDHYRSNTTPELVAQDRNLPLHNVIVALNEAKRPYHVATARVLCKHNRKLLRNRSINPSVLISRNGDSDNRKDHQLKAQELVKHFPIDSERGKLVLIDDCLANCKAAIAIGMQAIYIPTHSLDIRPLI